MIFRSILRAFPAASVLSAMRSKSAPVPQPAFTRAGFSICVHSWSLRDFTLFEAIELTSATGAGGIEIHPGQKIGGGHGGLVVQPDLPDDVIRHLNDHLHNNHIAALNFGVVEIPNNEAAARVIFEFARKLGLYGITTESLDAIDILEKLSVEHDIKVCFHNHPKPTALWHPDTIWRAIEGRHENLGYCADIGHWVSSSLDPLEIVRRIAPRVRSFHMKDRELADEWSHDRPFGTGVINIPAILEEVRKHGFLGNVSIEYEHNRENNLVEIAQCVGYLRACADMAASFHPDHQGKTRLVPDV